MNQPGLSSNQVHLALFFRIAELFPQADLSPRRDAVAPMADRHLKINIEILKQLLMNQPGVNSNPVHLVLFSASRNYFLRMTRWWEVYVKHMIHYLWNDALRDIHLPAIQSTSEA